MTSIVLNKRELAHVLACLRHAQSADVEAVDLDAFAHFRGIRCGPLSDDEVDALCERLNFGG